MTTHASRSWFGPGTRRRNVIIAVVIAMLAIPATLVLASDTFGDVPTSAYYHDSVNAIANAGITSGCVVSPPKYCPNSSVTRGQMAVFLDKLGALSGGDPVVNALSVNGHFIQGDEEDFDLAGGASPQCATTDAGQNQFGSYSITYQLFDIAEDSPPDLPPEKVNVQLIDDDDPPDVDGKTHFQVCFATLDGSAVPAGMYKTYFNFIVFVGQGLFGSASNASAASNPARFAR